MALRIFLFVMAVAWTPYGMYCFFVPGILETYAGVSAVSGTAVTELRAMYGGLQMAIGFSALLAFYNAAYVQRALFFLLCVFAGLALSRGLGAVMGGDTSGYTLGALLFESLGLGVTLWFYRRAPLRNEW